MFIYFLKMFLALFYLSTLVCLVQSQTKCVHSLSCQNYTVQFSVSVGSQTKPATTCAQPSAIVAATTTVPATTIVPATTTAAATTTAPATTPATIKLTTPTKQCAGGFTNVNNHCYKLVNTLGLIYSQSNKCGTVNAHLVSIDDADENRFLQSFIDANGIAGTYVTSGVRDKDTNNVWLWDYTYPLNSFFWAAGEPKFTNIVVKKGGNAQWFTVDGTGTGSYYAVCEENSEEVFA